MTNNALHAFLCWQHKVFVCKQKLNYSLNNLVTNNGHDGRDIFIFYFLFMIYDNDENEYC